MKSHGGRLIIVEIAIMYHRRSLRIESLRKEILQYITPENMMIKRGLEVPAPEMIDIGEIEAWKDIIPEEAIMMKEETTEEIMVPAQVEESIVQLEETTIMTGKIEEIRAPDIDQILGPDIGERTPQMKAEDTLDTTGEGDAKGPLVMEGP